MRTAHARPLTWLLILTVAALSLTLPVGAVPSPGWTLTTYYTPVEDFFSGEPVEALGCDGMPLGEHPEDFLAQARLQGSGKLADGGYIGWRLGSDCWEPRAGALGANGLPVQPFVTVAADPMFPFGTPARVVDCGSGIPDPAVCQLVRDSEWVVGDRGSAVTGLHLDLYVGEQDRPDFATTSPHIFKATNATVDIEGPVPTPADPDAPQFVPASLCGGAAQFPSSLGGVLPTTVTIEALSPDAARTVTLTTTDGPGWLAVSTTPGNPASAELIGAARVLDWMVGLIVPPAPMVISAVDDADPARSTDCEITPIVGAPALFDGQIPGLPPGLIPELPPGLIPELPPGVPIPVPPLPELPDPESPDPA